MAKTIEFTFARPTTVIIDRALLRATLEDVRDQLLRHDINGGPRNLSMDTVCDVRYDADYKCGTAACIGGWTSLFILGFEGRTPAERSVVNDLFSRLTDDGIGGRYLHNLFYEYGSVENYNEPNIAATAIQRYLDGKKPWPSKGDTRVPMPNVLPYRDSKPVAKKR